jgi:integrase
MKVKGVYEKRPGVWHYYVSYGGKQIHRRGGKLEAAIRGREKAQDRIDKGLTPFPEKPVEPATIAEVVKSYVGAIPRRETKRAETFARHLERLLPERINMIGEVTVRRYRATRTTEGVKDSTINRELLFLAAACRHAKCGTFFDALDKQSRARVFSKEDPDQPDRLSDEDVGAIVEKLPASYRNPVWLALLTGMRQREVLDLTWNEVRANGIRLPGSRTKSGYPRNVGLTDEMRALLPKRREDAALVFVGEDGGALSNNVGREWRKARKAVKLPRARFHDLRHEWASRYVEAGGTLIELMEAGGWRTLSQVQRYSKADKDRIRQTMAALSRNLNRTARIAVVLPAVSAS